MSVTSPNTHHRNRQKLFIYFYRSSKQNHGGIVKYLSELGSVRAFLEPNWIQPTKFSNRTELKGSKLYDNLIEVLAFYEESLFYIYKSLLFIYVKW
jgi:hypothetical protein